jgi:hypothetical protein
MQNAINPRRPGDLPDRGTRDPLNAASNSGTYDALH